MSEAPRGYTYWVEDDVLERFQSASIEQRLAWLEEMQAVTYALAPEEVRRRWQALRAGRAIDETCSSEPSSVPTSLKHRSLPE
ncbi:MAG: hypothetical protein IT378_03435 [Sandaracinaceae bacterium]|nr:hypothetical protein [Sandaracinaceae bacterium]